MASQFKELRQGLMEFIKAQKIFFVGTAANSGRVNISPKGMDTLKVLDANTVAWLNLTGSGNETAAHILKNNRMTLMFCAFEDPPLILRLYGTATIYHTQDPEFKTYKKEFPILPGTRQIIVLNIDLVQTSCGYGVPLMEFKKERTRLKEWAQEKGPDQMEAYWAKKNTKSIDGFETEILK